MEIVLIAAVAANGVIGRDGTLPWHLPEDLAHFKRTTMGHPVIVGRVAFEDVLAHLDEPLPGRTNIVMSRSDPPLPDGVILVDGVDAAVDAARQTGTDTAFVAGGATVYEQFLPIADRMILTELHATHEGDVRFPAYDAAAWTSEDRISHEKFDIVEYRRATPP